jgi:hypothetical protein
MGLVRLASKMPTQKTKLLALVRESLREAGWDPKQIAERKPGPLKRQPDEGYLAGEFTQQEYRELREKQQGGNMASPDRTASEDELRRNLIRLAHERPELRAKLLPILTAKGKVPEALKDHQFKPGEGGGKGKGKKKDKGDDKMPADVLEKFEKKDK